MKTFNKIRTKTLRAFYALYFVMLSFCLNAQTNTNQLVVLPNTQIKGIDFIHFSNDSAKTNPPTSYTIDTKHIYLLNNTTFFATEEVNWEQVKIIYTIPVKTNKKTLIVNHPKVQTQLLFPPSNKVSAFHQHVPIKSCPSQKNFKQSVASSISVSFIKYKQTMASIITSSIPFDVSYNAFLSQTTTCFGSDHKIIDTTYEIHTTRPPPMSLIKDLLN